MQLSRKLIVPAVIAGSSVLGVAGGSMLSVLSANAASTTSTTAATSQTTTPSSTNQTPPDPSKGGHVGPNGVKEELLTGDTAAKATAAAQKALPGATIDRVETDAEGAAYEAHVTKSDGSHVTLKMDSIFNVTSTESGPGGPGGPPPQQQN